jgi:hypothetical protein
MGLQQYHLMSFLAHQNRFKEDNLSKREYIPVSGQQA